eukprot:g3462.t1
MASQAQGPGLLPLPPACLRHAMAHGRVMSRFKRTYRARGPGSCLWGSYFERKSRAEKRVLVRQPWVLPMAAQNLAAIAMQRVARGRLLRTGRDGTISARGGGGGNGGGGLGADGRRRRSLRAASAGLGSASQLDKYLARIEADEARADALGVDPPIEVGYQTWCATRIQAWARMVLAAPRVALARRLWCWRVFSQYHIAAMQLQYCFRIASRRRLMQVAGADSGLGAGAGAGWPGSPQRASAGLGGGPQPTEAAARVLQRAWRRCTHLRIYRYFRDLLRFRNAGEPRQLLRAINPNEAGMLDAAAGVRVRFRLGGRRFPPTIFYKIFTQSALCDVGAFAPRDYVRARAEHKPLGGTRGGGGEAGGGGAPAGEQGSIRVGGAFFDTTVGGGRGASDDRDGWYQRYENNAWRPVSVRSLQELEEAPEAHVAASRSSRFHYSRMARRQEVQASRKRRQREWMRKLYGLGAQGGTPEGVGARAGPEGEDAGGAGLQALAEPKSLTLGGGGGGGAAAKNSAYGEDGVGGGGGEGERERDDELLRWSSELDYNSYVQNWHGIATSALPDAKADAVDVGGADAGGGDAAYAAKEDFKQGFSYR